MKRRILALMLAALLLASLIPAGSASGIFFVAFNDTVPMTLSTDVAPYYQNGILLVPHTAFGVNGMGVSASYDAEKRIVTLSGKNQRLTFNMTNGIATDESGTGRKITCVMKNGIAFLPAGFCSAHLGVSVTLLYSKDNYTVLRFTNGTQAYDDGLFIQKAENLISYRIEQHEAEQTPQKPVVTPQPQPQQPVEEETPGIGVYLAVESIEAVDSALRALSGRGTPAVFFLTGEEIRENPDKVLAIRAAGYPIGLTVSEDAADVAANLADANAALDDLTQSKTLLVLVSAEQEKQAEGYFTVSRGKAVSVREAVRGERQTCFVICRTDCASVLSQLREENARFYLLRETTPL